MEKIIRDYLNTCCVFIRFYPDNFTNRKDSVYYLSPLENANIGFLKENKENFKRFINNYNQISTKKLTDKSLRMFADEILFRNRKLRLLIKKTDLKILIKDIIFNTLSIKIGFDMKIDKLFNIGRQKCFDTKPLKKESRIPVKASIDDVIYVCANNEEPFVSSPGVIVDKTDSLYTIFYLTNLIGNKETRRIPINDYNFVKVDNISIGWDRIQSIENKIRRL